MINLLDKKIYDEVKKQVADTITNDDLRRALIFVKNMEIAVQSAENINLSSNPDLQEEYMHLTNQLRFVCLSALSDKEIIELFEQRMKIGLGLDDVDLVSKVRGKLMADPIFTDRDALKLKLRQALMRNQEIIGLSKIKVDQVPSEPNIANWLKKYHLIVGPTPATSVQQNQFFASDPDIKILETEDKNLIKKLINLYEFLKLSSVTPEGFENRVIFKFNDQIKILNKGQFEEPKIPLKYAKIIEEVFTKLRSQGKMAVKADLPVQAKPVENLVLHQEILQAYQGDGKFQANVAKEQTKLSKSTNKDNKKLRQEFYKSVQDKNIYRTIAAFRLLAETNDLGRFLREDEKLNKFMSVVIGKLSGPDDANNFTKDPSGRQSIKIFIQYILQQRLGLTASETARVGAQLSNIFKQQGNAEYENLAYYDVNEKKFKWLE